ncbi:unnamed protein product [Musa acuminata subsp. malaccensis]|uniref:(wild Malaysian banana) hypothetical protein n=1 Tax=Musa acuminata subsp. malaccensis TaxID=214687 RepID=A0A804JFP9_MUSAM|nr:PREDICTED: uncharacterized protein LOC103987563 [Musa acuminata subsp. malaccensis]CAG1846112.1 unnamed protein product [Musa acuminata subsp. malaccensis]
MASKMKRPSSSSSLPSLLLSSLNLFLLVLASASFSPVFLLRTSPTSSGWALVAVSSATVVSSLLGFFSQLTHLCFLAHVSFVLASSVGQALGFLALFLRPDPSLQLLGSARSRREQRALAKVEEALLLGMFLVQSLELVAACAVQRWWARQFEEVEAEREASVRKRSRRMARVQEEAIANAAAMAEAKARELEEKMRANNKGQWVKNDFEG